MRENNNIEKQWKKKKTTNINKFTQKKYKKIHDEQTTNKQTNNSC